MKSLLFSILLLLSVSSFSLDYVSVTDDCPFVTFTNSSDRKVSVSRKYIKVTKTSQFVVVNIVGTNLSYQWNESQADAYGGRTLTQLYQYILGLITTQC